MAFRAACWWAQLLSHSLTRSGGHPLSLLAGDLAVIVLWRADRAKEVLVKWIRLLVSASTCRYCISGLVLLFAGCPPLVAQQSQPVPDVDGTITQTGLVIAGCQVSSMTVRYHLSTLVGEPVVNGSYTWTAGPGTSSGCLPSDLEVWIRVEGSGGNGFVNLNPVVPEAGKWGMNVAGSPDWDKYFCAFQGNRATQCLDAASAKRLWLSRVTVTGFVPSLGAAARPGDPSAQAQQQAAPNQQQQAAAQQAQQHAAQQAQQHRADEDAQRQRAAQERRKEAADSAARANAATRAQASQLAGTLASTDVGMGRLGGQLLLGVGATYATVHPAGGGGAIEGTGLLFSGALTQVFAMGHSGTQRLELEASGGYGLAADLSSLTSQSSSTSGTSTSTSQVAVTYGRAVTRYWLGIIGLGAYGDYRSYSANGGTTSVSGSLWSVGPTVAIGDIRERGSYFYAYGFAGLTGSTLYGGGVAFGLNLFTLDLSYSQQQSTGDPNISSASHMAVTAGMRLPW
jgi:hypothetical protein